MRKLQRCLGLTVLAVVSVIGFGSATADPPAGQTPAYTRFLEEVTVMHDQDPTVPLDYVSFRAEAYAPNDGNTYWWVVFVDGQQVHEDTLKAVGMESGVFSRYTVVNSPRSHYPAGYAHTVQSSLYLMVNGLPVLWSQVTSSAECPL